MKKTILVITIIFLSLVVYTQNIFKPETYFGVKMGGNISGIIFDPPVSQNINSGFTSGIVFKHISQKNLGIQIELNYTQAGWNESLDSTNSYIRRLNYIQLPFMTHINLGMGKTKFIFNIGPYVSYLLSEKEKINLLEEEEEEEEEENDYYQKKIHNKTGFGLCLGFGITRHTSIGLFQVESRISSSLTDIFKDTTDTPFSSSKSFNAELSLSYLIDYNIIGKLSKKN